MTMLKKTAAAALALMLAAEGVCADSAGTLRIPETAAPKIDGSLDDAVWSRALKIDGLYVSGTDKAAKDTEVYLCRDKKWLYIGLRCVNPKMVFTDLSARSKDSQVWRDESVEIFIRPDKTKPLYCHFGLNFGNTRLDQRISGPGGSRDPGWNPPWRSMTKRLPDGWTAGAAIPLFALESENLDRMELNIVRNFISVELDQMGAKLAEETVHHVLKKDGKGSAHDFANFLPVSGFDGLRPEPAFAPQIDRAEITGYRIDGGKIFYGVRLKIEPGSPVTGRARVQVIEGLDDKEIVRLAEDISVTGPRTLELKVPSEDFRARAVKVSLAGGDGGVLDSRSIDDSSPLRVIKKAFAGRSYYTDEKSAEIRVLTGLPEDAAKNAELTLELNGEKLTGIKDIKPLMTPEIPVEKLRDGCNNVNVRIMALGKELASETVELKKLEPRPGFEVKCDHIKNRLLKDGNPFFPVGIYESLLIHNDEKRVDEIFKFLAEDIGLNTIVDHHEKHLKNTAGFMSLAEKHGLNVIVWNSPMPRGFQHKQPPPLTLPLPERLKSVVEWCRSLEPDLAAETKILRDHRNLLGYYNVDEPNLVNPEERIAVAEWYYKTVAGIDPYRPQALLYSAHIPNGGNWTRWCEMLGYDVYPKLFMPKAGVRVEPGLCTAYYACELRKRCLADNKLMFFVPVANVQNPGRTPVGMDKTRMLCQARTALIYGAKSLLYFALECVCGDEAWDALRIISAQTRAMAPALLNGDIEQRVSYTPGEFKPAEGIFPMVNAAVFRYPDGKYLLLAANIMPHAVETVFTVKGLRKAEKLFDAGDKTSSITLREESFTEKIGPYGALACLLGLAEPEPVSVSVAMTALEKEKAPAVDVAGIIRQLRMSPDGNCCPNPCFKERFVKGIPDFYRPYFCVNTDFGAGKKGSTCYVDDETLWNGNPSLKMTKTEPEKTRGMFGIFYPPGKTGKMTFSFYAKGETGTESVEFLILSKVRKSFKLARDWTRCHVTFDTPANECEYLIIPGKGSVWISGLQCGRGETPSEFRDDSVLREVKVTEDPDNLLKNGHAEYGDTRGWTAPPALSDKFITKDARNGVFAFKMTPGPALSLLSGEPLPVDQRASYELYGAFKSQSGATRLNFGLILHDSEKRVIRAENVFPVRGTETELAAPCAADDKTIKVKDAASWKAGCRLAFETDKGLPNFNVSGVAIDSVHRTGGDWFVKLRGPCGFAYPAGTKVAEHRDGAGGIFPCSAEIPESWTELKGKIGPSDFKKWPGAKFVSVTIIPKLNSPGAGLLADDISLKKIP